MVKPVFYRLLQSILVLLIVSVLTFVLLSAAGGDALTTLAGDPKVSTEAIAKLRRIYGLDQPLVVRYARWVAGAVTGDLGYSYYFQLPVRAIIGPRLLRTGALAITALTIAWGFALSLGIQAARRPRGWLDRLCSAFVLWGSSVPRLVVALLVLALAARVSWLNVDGFQLVTEWHEVQSAWPIALANCPP